MQNVKPGARCSAEPYLNCGKCIVCRLSKGNCCTEIRVLGGRADGGMRDEFILPAAVFDATGYSCLMMYSFDSPPTAVASSSSASFPAKPPSTILTYSPSWPAATPCRKIFPASFAS